MSRLHRCYIISYDLVGNRKYPELYKAIKSYGTWARITESTWAVLTDDSAVMIRDYLDKFIDLDDGIVVVRSGSEAAWRNLICTHEWLKKNL